MFIIQQIHMHCLQLTLHIIQLFVTQLVYEQKLFKRALTFCRMFIYLQHCHMLCEVLIRLIIVS
jgi:hypothetical protein